MPEHKADYVSGPSSTPYQAYYTCDMAKGIVHCFE